MIKFTYNLSNYKPVKVLPEIKRVIKIDRQKLQDGIDTFQRELDWRQMWSVDDAEKRLEDGWWFYVIEKRGIGYLNTDRYIGWAWFDTSNKQFCNLYVHKDYRSGGYGKELVYARLNECKKQNIQKVWMEVNTWNKSIQKIGQELEWTPKIHYTFWTGGYDSTFLVCKFLLEGKIVQPIYIDDRVNHGGYHANPLVKQRGGDTYPRKSTEIELERMDWLRDKIYDKIPNSKELLLDIMVIDEPMEEDVEISKVVEKYNEWIPNTVYKNKHGENKWLPVQTDILLRFQKQFGLKVEFPIEHIEGEWYEIIDDIIVDGNIDVSELPEEHKDLEVFSGFICSIRNLYKEDILEIANKDGYEELLYYTWSCWYPIDGKPCNKCKVCKDRIIECRN